MRLSDRFVRAYVTIRRLRRLEGVGVALPSYDVIVAKLTPSIGHPV